MPKITWQNFRIVIVDNGSTDGSEDFLRRHLPEEEIIQSASNLGFAGGCNVGIRYALNSGADYVWLLNKYAVADPQALTELFLRSWRIIQLLVSLAPRSTTTMIHEDLDSPEDMGEREIAVRHRGANVLDEGQFDEKCEVGSVSGCSMLVPALLLSCP